MQKLLLKDYDKIKPYLDDADYEGYNSNFVTMMMWDHEYEIFYEIKENYLIMLHTYMNEKFFAMPFCKPEYYQEAQSFWKNPIFLDIVKHYQCLHLQFLCIYNQDVL